MVSLKRFCWAGARQRKTTEKDRGFAFLLLAILVFVAAAIGITVLADSALKEDQRRSDIALLADVHKAIVGNPDDEQFGYLGDVGDYPGTLADLMRAPSGVVGWNGPYLSEALFNGTSIYDSYGTPLEYFLNLTAGSIDKLAIISAGADHDSSNGASNPNDWTLFTTPYPSSGAAYFVPAENADNLAYPDFSTNANAVNYEDVGTINYLITNYNNDPQINAVVPACPLLYNIVATSDTRGTTDAVTLPYVPASSASSDPAQITGFLQGYYRMAITSAIMKDTLFSESVANFPGRTRTKTVRGAHINSNTTVNPQFRQFVRNTSGVTIDVYRFTSRIRNNLASTGVATDLGSFRVCANMRALRDSDDALLDSWVQPWGADTTHTVGSTYNTLTVTNTGGGGAAARRYLIVTEDDIPLGIVYRRKTVTFSHIPNGAAIEVTDQTGAAIAGGTFTMGSAPDTRTY